MGLRAGEVPPGWTEYEYQIAMTGQEVCRTLGFQFQLSTLAWQEWSPFSRIGSDDCLFIRGTVMLSMAMKGKLDPEEWRPIMAASLIYNRRLLWSFPLELGLSILLLLGLALVGGGLVYAALGSVGVLVYLLLLFGPFLEQRFSQVRRKLKLKADIEAARITGSGPFLAVLMKIDSLGMKDVEKVKKRRLLRHFTIRPSISERIQNLRKSTTEG